MPFRRKPSKWKPFWPSVYPREALLKPSSSTPEALWKPSRVEKPSGSPPEAFQKPSKSLLEELHETLWKPSRSPPKAFRKPFGRPPEALQKPYRSPPEAPRNSFIKPSGSPPEALQKPSGCPLESPLDTQIKTKLTSKACNVSPGSICISNHLCCRHWFIDILCCWPVWSKSWIKDLASLDMHLSSAPCKSYWQDKMRATYRMKKKCQIDVSITNLTLVISAQKWYFVFKIVLKVQLFWDGHKNLNLSSAPCKSNWQDRIRATYKMRNNMSKLPI